VGCEKPLTVGVMVYGTLCVPIALKGTLVQCGCGGLHASEQEGARAVRSACARRSHRLAT
jgi:hypothetical protein